MKKEEKQARLKQLLEEFQSSGKDINTFLEAKLRTNGREDASEIIKQISSTLQTIDENYTKISKLEAEEHTIPGYLEPIIDKAQKDNHLSNEQMGEFLEATTKTILSSSEQSGNEESSEQSGNEESSEQSGNKDEKSRPYEGIDADQQITELTTAIEAATIKELKDAAKQEEE